MFKKKDKLGKRNIISKVSDLYKNEYNKSQNMEYENVLKRLKIRKKQV